MTEAPITNTYTLSDEQIKLAMELPEPPPLPDMSRMDITEIAMLAESLAVAAMAFISVDRVELAKITALKALGARRAVMQALAAAIKAEELQMLSQGRVIKH